MTPNWRSAACLALEAALGERASADLRTLLRDPREEIQLAACQALANHGDRRALPALIELLQSDSLQVRSMANTILRATTSENFGHVCYANAEQRLAVAKLWHTWLSEKGENRQVEIPARFVKSS